MRAAFLVFGLVGCAATYRPPSTTPTNFIRPLQGERAATFEAAKRALVLDGYTIQSTDAAAGIISTAPRTHRLTADDCDCGTTLGLPYIKDKRTQTTVAIDPTPKTEPIAGGDFVPHAAGCRRWRSAYSAGVRSPSALCGRRWL